MRMLVALVTLVAALGALARPAYAEDPEAKGGTRITYRHGHQFGVSAEFGVGYRSIFRYHDADFCGKADSGACPGVAPPWVELDLSYAATDHFEVLMGLRIALIDDFTPATWTGDAPHQFAFLPGIRYYIDDRGSLKFFSSFQLVIDRTDYSADGVSAETDIGVRTTLGLMVDLHRTFGLYATLGGELGFVRWLSFQLDAGIGLQVRFP